MRAAVAAALALAALAGCAAPAPAGTPVDDYLASTGLNDPALILVPQGTPVGNTILGVLGMASNPGPAGVGLANASEAEALWAAVLASPGNASDLFLNLVVRFPGADAVERWLSVGGWCAQPGERAVLVDGDVAVLFSSRSDDAAANAAWRQARERIQQRTGAAPGCMS